MSFPRYEKYKDSGVEWLGDVPEHWQITQLRHLVECLDGRRIPLNAAERSDRQGDVPYWGANCIVDYVDEALLDEELVLLGEDGAPFFDRTKPVAFFTQGPVWPNNHVHVLRPRTGVSGPFVAHALNATDYSQFIDGSTRDKLTQGAMAAIPISMPCIEEQVSIATFLDHETAKIDALVDEQKRLIELLKEKRQAVISHAVTKGLNSNAPMKDSGVEWLGEVPAHWDLVATKRLFRVVADPAPDDNEHELLSIYTAIGVRPRQDLEQRGNRATTQDGYWMVRKGDLIVNKLLAWMGAIGVSDYEGVTSPAYDILRATVPLEPRFYDYLYRCGICFTEFRRHSRGIMDMRLRLYFEELGQLVMPFPPLDEQRRIVAHLQSDAGKFDALSSEALRAIELLQERRTALISAAVTGKIDVRSKVEPPEPALA